MSSAGVDVTVLAAAAARAERDKRVAWFTQSGEPPLTAAEEAAYRRRVATDVASAKAASARIEAASLGPAVGPHAAPVPLKFYADSHPDSHDSPHFATTTAAGQRMSCRTNFETAATPVTNG